MVGGCGGGGTGCHRGFEPLRMQAESSARLMACWSVSVCGPIQCK